MVEKSSEEQKFQRRQEILQEAHLELVNYFMFNGIETENKIIEGFNAILEHMESKDLIEFDSSITPRIQEKISEVLHNAILKMIKEKVI